MTRPDSRLLGTIEFGSILRDVRRVEPKPEPSIDELLRACEQEAFERGRQAGELALRESLLEQRTEFMTLQRGVFAHLRNSIPEVMAQCEAAMVQLAFEVAGRLVAGVPISTEMVQGVVREAVGELTDAGRITVHLHPEDLELLQKANAPVLSEEIAGERLEFEPSANVTRGGCILRTRFGSVDARRETKIEQLRQAVAS
jgi:flagellar assembly protein FliH